MKPSQQRVVDEKRHLDEKIDKLRSFMFGNPTFTSVPLPEKIRLAKQLEAMELYSEVLGERISAFEP